MNPVSRLAAALRRHHRAIRAAHDVPVPWRPGPHRARRGFGFPAPDYDDMRRLNRDFETAVMRLLGECGARAERRPRKEGHDQ